MSSGLVWVDGNSINQLILGIGWSIVKWWWISKLIVGRSMWIV